MATKLDQTEHAHQNEVYFPKRRVWLTGEVNEKMYQIASKNLCILDNSSGDIFIEINSEGGDLSAAKGIYDRIKCCQNRVNIEVYGSAFSSASLILQAADTRMMAPHADLMLHIGQNGTPMDHPTNNERASEYLKLMDEWMMRVYWKRIKEKRPRFTLNQTKELLKFDTYLTPKQALELGLIDTIGGN